MKLQYKIIFIIIICVASFFAGRLTIKQQEVVKFVKGETVVQTILQERGDGRGLITLISSNNGICDNDTLELYGDRIVSRLKKTCNYIELKGNDRRK